MKRSFEEVRDLFVQALQTSNWNDLAIWSTDLLKYHDNLPWVWVNRGIALSKLGHPIDALLNYEKALQYSTDEQKEATIHVNRGAAYYDMMKYDKALECYHQALALDDKLPQAYMNIGNIRKDKKDFKGAIASYRKSHEVDPKYAEGELALSMMLLKDGSLEEGWKHYECRWRSGQLPPRPLKCPVWNGEDLTDKSILVYGEQGLGDFIQFSRYARILAKKYPMAKIIIEGRQPLKRLFESMPGIHAVINAGEENPHTDYAIPMMTLAAMLTPTIESIPPSSNEFNIQLKDKLRWSDKIVSAMPGGDKFRIGVCWAGLSRITNVDAARVDSIRSTTLKSFAPLCVSDIHWISLQKGSPSEQLKDLPRNMIIGDFTEDMYDFYETAAAIAACDLVITVDTAVAHVAASIGKETWILSRWDGCWRWFHGREDSPWYPTARIFEQPAPHDWDNLMIRVAKELRTRLDSSQAA